MPVKRRRRMHRGTYLRRRSRLATKAYVKKVLDKKIEDKTHEILQGFRPASTYTDYVLTQIAAGTGESNRVGTDVKVKSVFMRAIAEVNATATKNFMRVIIWIDRSPAATLTGTDIMENSASSQILYSVYDTDSAGSYTILYDRSFVLSNSTRYASMTKFYKKFKLGHRVKYVGTGATNYGRGQIKITYVSDDASAGTNLPYFSMNARVTYEDA